MAVNNIEDSSPSSSQSYPSRNNDYPTTTITEHYSNFPTTPYNKPTPKKEEEEKKPPNPKNRYSDEVFMKNTAYTPLPGITVAIYGPTNIPWLANGNVLLHPYNRLIGKDEYAVFLDNVKYWENTHIDMHHVIRDNKKNFEVLTKELERRNELLEDEKLDTRSLQSIILQLWIYYPGIFLNIKNDCVTDIYHNQQMSKRIEVRKNLKLQELKAQSRVNQERIRLVEYERKLEEEIKKKFQNEISKYYATVNHDFYKSETKLVDMHFNVSDLFTYDTIGSNTTKYFSTCGNKVNCWVLKNSNFLNLIPNDIDILSHEVIRKIFSNDKERTDDMYQRLRGVFVISRDTIHTRLDRNDEFKQSVISHFNNLELVYNGCMDIAEELRLRCAAVKLYHTGPTRDNLNENRRDPHLYLITFIPYDTFKDKPCYIGNLGIVIGCGVVDRNTAHPYSKPMYLGTAKNGFSITYDINCHNSENSNRKFWSIINNKVVEIIPNYDKNKPEKGIIIYSHNGGNIDTISFSLDDFEAMDAAGIYLNKYQAQEALDRKVDEIIETRKLKEEDRKAKELKNEGIKNKLEHDERMRMINKPGDIFNAIGKIVTGLAAIGGTVVTVVTIYSKLKGGK